jgi:hypothetical protein
MHYCSRLWNHGHNVIEVKSEWVSARKLPLRRYIRAGAAIAVVRAKVSSGPVCAACVACSGLATSAERVGLTGISRQFVAIAVVSHGAYSGLLSLH